MLIDSPSYPYKLLCSKAKRTRASRDKRRPTRPGAAMMQIRFFNPRIGLANAEEIRRRNGPRIGPKDAPRDAAAPLGVGYAGTGLGRIGHRRGGGRGRRVRPCAGAASGTVQGLLRRERPGV